MTDVRGGGASALRRLWFPHSGTLEIIPDRPGARLELQLFDAPLPVTHAAAASVKPVNPPA